MAHLRLITLCSLLLSVTLAQQYSGNYVESDYDYDQPPPPPRPAPAPRSFSRPSPPSSSSLRSLGPSSSSSSSARVTPVPILKQINRHNEDGSYTYGYEGADGSFKIETKLTNGEVMGKYGYVDDLGKVRVVEYGANKFGFMPSGEGITVAPPTLVDETRKGDAPDYDDGQYYEQPPQRAPVSSPRFSSRPGPPPPRPAPRPAPAPVRPAPPPPSHSHGYETYETETDFSAPAPAPPRPSNLGPAPPRAQIPGAVPSGGSNTGIVYSPSQRPPRPQSFSAPSPPRPNSPAPAPSPAFRPQSSFSAPSRPQARQAGGILDQLAKDYALPPGGQPLHDITFGFY